MDCVVRSNLQGGLCVCSDLQGGLCVCVVICKVDCVCVVICKVDCVVCSDLQEKSSKRGKLQFFPQNFSAKYIVIKLRRKIILR